MIGACTPTPESSAATGTRLGRATSWWLLPTADSRVAVPDRLHKLRVSAQRPRKKSSGATPALVITPTARVLGLVLVGRWSVSGAREQPLRGAHQESAPLGNYSAPSGDAGPIPP